MTYHDRSARAAATWRTLLVLAVCGGCSGGMTNKGDTNVNLADGAPATGGAGGAAAGGASAAGGSKTGGATSSGGSSATGGTTSTGGRTTTGCSADSDCRAVADYCTGCDCRALGPGETLPACTGPGVQCFADPCMGKTAACVNGSCQISTAGGGQCSTSGGSCANGETCCSGLTCCAGVPVPPGNEYCSSNCPISDRNIKQGFMSVDPDRVLEKVSSLPISEWSYMTEGTRVTHLGPMAQDFKAQFGLGESDKTILQVDADGVALTAIQALNRRVEKLAAENAELRARVDELSRKRDGARR